MKRIVKINGMTCEHCVKSVTSALNSLEGISSVEVSLADNTAVIDGDASDQSIKDLIDDIGFEVEGIE